MTKRKRIIIVLSATFALPFIILAAILASEWVWDQSAFLRGQIAAMRDARRGEYKILVSGLPTAWRPEAAKLLHEQHPNASVVAVAGCIVTPGLIEYQRGYNAYSISAATRHFGHDVFDETFREAEADYHRRHPTM